MSNTEVKIESCFFGGYNKKCTDAYINELRQTIENLQIDLQAANEADKSNMKRIKELEKACRVHKETIQSREDIIKRQEEALQDKKDAIQCGQERIAELKVQLEAWDGRYKELETQLEQQEQAVEEGKDQISKLEDRLEKQQWLYEEFFRDKEKIPVSKLEKYIQKSIKRRIRQKR